MNIHEKIMRLRKMVQENGATEAEAINAMELASKLMEKHNITEDQLKNTEFKRDMTKKNFDKSVVFKLCGRAIADFCDVDIWQMEGTVTVFGFNGDMEMAEFLIDLILTSMKYSWKQYLKKGEYDSRITRYSLYWSFHHGFADRINHKLREISSKRKENVPVTGTDLVVMKNSLVEEARKEMFPDLEFAKTRKSKTRVYKDIYEDGKSEGSKVNLNRPINSERNENGPRL